MAQPVGAIAAGRAADIVVLDADHPALVGRRGDALLDSLFFGPAAGAVRDVMVGGAWVVRDGRHRGEQATPGRFRSAMAALPDVL